MGRPRQSSISFVPREEATTELDEGQEPVPADMFESFHSEHLPSKRVSWSTERHARRGGSITRSPRMSRSTFLPPSMQVTPTPTDAVAGASAALERGRSLQRDVDSPMHAPTESPESTRRSSKAASRRSATMVFLAVWALFGVRTLTGSNIPIPSARDHTNSGRVLYAKEIAIPDLSLASASPTILLAVIPTTTIAHDPTRYAHFDDKPPHELPPEGDIPDQPSAERILGRIFAWLCTTLYLTSRLPQIWKNVRLLHHFLSRILITVVSLPESLLRCVYRHLSERSSSKHPFQLGPFHVSLRIRISWQFVLCCIDIVVPPVFGTPSRIRSLHQRIDSVRASSSSSPLAVLHFRRYLLGSGGTLMFDITIVSQSFIYRPRSHRGRGRSIRARTLNEEETGLLTGDTLAQPPLSSSGVSQHGLTTNESNVQSRGWTLSSSRNNS